MISRERGRSAPASRSLMLFDTGSSRSDRNGTLLARIISALSVSTRETDETGWYEKNAVVGILFTEIAVEDRNSILSRILSKISGTLQATLTLEQFNQISISFHLFPEQWNSEIEEGLSEWLRSDIPISEVIYQINSPGLSLWLLPAGGPLRDPVELMQSGRAALPPSWIALLSPSIGLSSIARSFCRWRIPVSGRAAEPNNDSTRGEKRTRQLQKAVDALDGTNLIGVLLYSSSNNEHKSYYTYYSPSHSNGTPE